MRFKTNLMCGLKRRGALGKGRSLGLTVPADPPLGWLSLHSPLSPSFPFHLKEGWITALNYFPTEFLYGDDGPSKLISSLAMGWFKKISCAGFSMYF